MAPRISEKETAFIHQNVDEADGSFENGSLGQSVSDGPGANFSDYSYEQVKQNLISNYISK